MKPLELKSWNMDPPAAPVSYRLTIVFKGAERELAVSRQCFYGTSIGWVLGNECR